MKKSLLLILAFWYASLNAQTMHVEGKDLYTAEGQKITLRGINYPIIDEGLGILGNQAQYRMKIEEAAKTGANAIRIPWYSNGVHWLDQQVPGTIDGFINDGTLSDILSYCHEQGMIPILELHDPNKYNNQGVVEEYRLTCSDNWDYFNTVAANWWKSPSILNLIEENKEYLVINLANEFGYAMWTGNTTQAMNVFKMNYLALINDLRQLGVEVPIMIDAPDCGQSSSELLSVAEEMVDNDADHNLIFSAHAYWYTYAPNQNAIEAKLDEAVNKDVHFILGEVASRQDVTGTCSHALDYPVILNQSCSRDIGWLGWAYSQDCDSRIMTPDGMFDNLTPYGEDLVYNQDYGLISGGDCAAAPLAVVEVDQDETKFGVAPNPAAYHIKFTHAEKIRQAKILDNSGRLIFTIGRQFENVDISFLSPGTYVISIETKDGKTSSAKLIKK